MGLSPEKHFQNFHRVLNRALVESGSQSMLLGLLVSAFAVRGPIVLGLDDTIERRRGDQIKAKGIYRDPVRSSHSHFVKASGLRWLSLMLLAPIPWAKGMGAAFFDGIVAFGALLSEVGTSAQKVDRMGGKCSCKSGIGCPVADWWWS